MVQFHESTVKYQKQDENGNIKSITEKYLIDSVSVTEAEARLVGLMEQLTDGEYKITSVVQKKDVEHLKNPNEDGIFYRASCRCVLTDSDSGATVRTTYSLIFRSVTFDDALKFLKEHLSTWLVEVTIANLGESSIEDVLLYNAPDDRPIHERMKEKIKKIEPKTLDLFAEGGLADQAFDNDTGEVFDNIDK